MKFLLTLVALPLLTLFTSAVTETDDLKPCLCKDQENFPVPPQSLKTLFYIQRTPNKNTILYDLNIDEKGQLDSEEPVYPYWIRYSEEGQKEDLSYIQRNYAYGLKSKRISKDEFELRFVSYKRLPFKLK